MRLTLRTLLAYRDRVLNATDLEDMHGRIQQSAMASNLLKRLESLAQRSNILAPPIEGKGLGADANSIAEYLDDTLKGDKVPELERICLESDVQLAELAQCHSLLSAALSTAVDVPVTLRQRIVALSDEKERVRAQARRQDDAHAIKDGESASNRLRSTADSEPGSGRMRFRTDDAHSDGHTDQTSATTRRQDRAQSPLENGKSAKSKDRPLVAAQAVTAPMMASGGDSIRPSGLDLEGSHLAHEVPEYLRGRSRDGWRGPVAILALVGLLVLLVWQSIGSFSSVRDMFTQAPNDSSKESSNDSNVTEATTPSTANGNAAPTTDASKANGDSLAASKDTTSKGGDLAGMNGLPSLPVGPSSPNAMASADAEPKGATAKPNKSDAANDKPAINVPQVAQWLPDKADMKCVVLVQSNVAGFYRLQAGDSLPSGCQVFVPASNRPKLELKSGPSWQVCGMTHALLALPEENSAPLVPEVYLQLGRAVLTGRAAGERLLLTTPAGTVRVALADQGSASVELDYQPVAHGPVGNRTAHVPVLTIIALTGEATIDVADKNVKLAAGTRTLIQAGQVGAQDTAEPPQWTDASSERPVDLQAASDMSDAIGNTSLAEDLQKLATHRRSETRALAAQTLALMGSWDWVAQPKSSLSEPRDRNFWPVIIERTRQILAAHPENIPALASSLKQLDQLSSEWRMQMWLGLDSAQLQLEGGKRLIASLESEALIERILAIQQLQRATGKDLGYRAGEPNKTIVGQWTRDLFSSKLPLLPVPKS